MAQTDTDTLTLKALDEAAVTAWSLALGDPAWLRDRRLEALTALGKLERPTNREEAWRFTDPKRAGLDRHPFVRSAGESSVSAEAAGVLADERDSQPGGIVTTVDGQVTAAHLDDELAAKGVILTDLITAAREHPHLVEPRLMTTAAPFDEDWFLALHATLVSAGTFLYVPRGVEVQVPLGAVYRRTLGGATFGHTLIVVEPEASLTFVQQHSSPEGMTAKAFHHGVTEVLIGERASVHFLTLQEWGSESVNHFGLQRVEVGRDASYRSFVVTLGGGTVRISPETRMYQGAQADFLGAAFADDGQRFEHRTTTHHVEPYARSELLFKGGLLGGSTNILYGNVLIHPGARGSDAGQTMRNLVLSPNAHAEAIPFLEIQNSDVRCMHAAATGRLDELHLFYLQSRGILRQEARRMAVFGFFEEILAQATVPAVRRRLEAALEAELASMIAGDQAEAVGA
jgi:Fe-S cluster assembly protein SufD